MNEEILAGLILTGVIALLFIGLGALLLTGRGAFLIAGYNTLPKAEREKFDARALCRFVGKILLGIGLLSPLLALGGLLDRIWPGLVYAAAVAGLCVFAAIYANTGNRFRKK